MSQLPSSPDPITLVISEIVEPQLIEKYEVWTKGINRAASEFEGYLGTSIIRPRDHDHPEYVTIVKFDNYEHFRRWQFSPTCQEWIKQGQALVVNRTRQERHGLELWFNLPQHPAQSVVQPAYYKQVIVGAIAVYPLIVLASALLGPVLKGLHPQLALFISVLFVSALLTYPVMPMLTHLLNFWLYPKH